MELALMVRSRRLVSLKTNNTTSYTGTLQKPGNVLFFDHSTTRVTRGCSLIRCWIFFMSGMLTLNFKIRL